MSSPGRVVAAAQEVQKKKAAQLAEVFRIAERAGRDGVLLAAVLEDVRVVGQVGGDGAGADRLDRQRPGLRIVGVGPHHELQTLAQGGLPLGGEIVVGAAFLPRPVVEDEDGFAVEPVGGPVRGDVAAVPPDRAGLHAAHGLPDVLPGGDLAGSVEDLSLGGDDPLGDGRSELIDLSARPTQDGERSQDDPGESDPEPTDAHK